MIKWVFQAIPRRNMRKISEGLEEQAAKAVCCSEPTRELTDTSAALSLMFAGEVQL
jgi:hypothetical protein